MNIQLKIENKTLSEIKWHLEQHYPDEACGFLLALPENGDVISQISVENKKKGNRGRRFVMAPEQYRAAEVLAGQKEMKLAGIYHSHPDHPAKPSEYDRSHALPFFSYLIISVIGGKSKETRSWRLDDNRHFNEESLIIIK